jgi:hypothetical protein
MYSIRHALDGIGRRILDTAFVVLSRARLTLSVANITQRP